MKIFVTGISTDVGKTVVSAIFTESLQADYWKPIQAGDLQNSDSITIRDLISNAETVIHPESYRLNTPASPHLAAEIDNIIIDRSEINEPQTANHLIIEGAGGLFVPINDNQNIIDLIEADYQVVLVSKHYLGSINHTLLSIEALQNRNISILGIVFSGDENQATEKLILNRTGLKMLGRIEQEPYVDRSVILEYAELFREKLTLKNP